MYYDQWQSSNSTHQFWNEQVVWDKKKIFIRAVLRAHRVVKPTQVYKTPPWVFVVFFMDHLLRSFLTLLQASLVHFGDTFLYSCCTMAKMQLTLLFPPNLGGQRACQIAIMYHFRYSFRDSLGWLVFMVFSFFNSNPNLGINYHQLPIFWLQCCSLL